MEASQPPNISLHKASSTARRHSRSSSTNFVPADLLSELKAQSESIAAAGALHSSNSAVSDDHIDDSTSTTSTSSSSSNTGASGGSTTSSASFGSGPTSYAGFQDSIDSSVSNSSRTPSAVPPVPRRPSTTPSTTGPMSVGESGSSAGGGPDEWLEQAKKCKYLPESDMKRLCELVKECLMEGESGPTLSFPYPGSES